jgi:hypothetical protein
MDRRSGADGRVRTDNASPAFGGRACSRTPQGARHGSVATDADNANVASTIFGDGRLHRLIVAAVPRSGRNVVVVPIGVMADQQIERATTVDIGDRKSRRRS